LITRGYQKWQIVCVFFWAVSTNPGDRLCRNQSWKQTPTARRSHSHHILGTNTVNSSVNTWVAQDVVDAEASAMRGWQDMTRMEHLEQRGQRHWCSTECPGCGGEEAGEDDAWLISAGPWHETFVTHDAVWILLVVQEVFANEHNLSWYPLEN
jgi:hypothetical protein